MKWLATWSRPMEQQMAPRVHAAVAAAQALVVTRLVTFVQQVRQRCTEDFRQGQLRKERPCLGLGLGMMSESGRRL